MAALVLPALSQRLAAHVVSGIPSPGRPRPPTRVAAWCREDTSFSAVARQEAGRLLRRIQRGETLTMPHSRPMPAIGRRCHELRIDDDRVTWRIVYRTDPDAVVIVDVFQKTTQTTPADVVAACRRRVARYDADASEET
jgi:phage-related protein